MKKNSDLRKNSSISEITQGFFKITQGFEITQAHFDEETQSTGGLCHVHPPKKCSKKTSDLDIYYFYNII